MKIYNLCLILFIFFISCSTTEERTHPAEGSTSLPYNFDIQKIGTTYPINTKNPYDIVGSLHVELYKAYYAMDSLTSMGLTVAERVMVVANENEHFIGLTDQSYVLNSEVFSHLYDEVTCCSSELLRDSLVTSEATLSLQTLLATIIPYCNEEEDYAAIYNLLTSYENTILEGTLPLGDKQILLSTAAVVRHVMFERKKKPKKNTDPDWDLMIWRLAGTVTGATEDVEETIVYSVIFGILENGE